MKTHREDGPCGDTQEGGHVKTHREDGPCGDTVEGGHVGMEAQTGVMQLQTGERQGLPGATRS